VPAGTPQKGRFAGLLGSWLGWDLLGCWAPRRRPGLHSSGSPCKQQLARGKGSDAKCFCRFAGLPSSAQLAMDAPVLVELRLSPSDISCTLSCIRESKASVDQARQTETDDHKL
jgi:hypothetical protein